MTSDASYVGPDVGDETRWRQWAQALPASQVMGLRVVSATRGNVVVALDESVWPRNPNEAVHGGLVLAAADHAGALGVVSAAGNAVVVQGTATFHGEFLRPATGALTFSNHVVKLGRSLAFVDVLVSDSLERLCAKFTGTWSVNVSTSTESTDGWM